jgi:hypothetical protein
VSRERFVATDAIRDEVGRLASRGVPQDVIASIVRCDPKTLRKSFRQELDRGMAEADAQVIGSLFANAIGGNVTAQIYWAKTRLGWREAREPQKDIKNTDAEANYQTVVVLPDNDRDPKLTEELHRAQEKYFARKKIRQQPDSPEE